MTNPQTEDFDLPPRPVSDGRYIVLPVDFAHRLLECYYSNGPRHRERVPSSSIPPSTPSLEEGVAPPKMDLHLSELRASTRPNPQWRKVAFRSEPTEEDGA